MSGAKARASTPEELQASDEQRRADGDACLKAALEYEAMGWSVASLCPPDHVGVGRTHGRDCDSPGKSSWGFWKEFQERRPTVDEIRRKWRDLPTLNVGIFLGAVSGLVRVDVDGANGQAMLLEQSRGDLPATLEFVSGRSDGTGRGYLYRIPEGAVLKTTPMKRIKGDEPKQELRLQAKGALTVLPPSRHPQGGLYTWAPGHAPGEIEPALMPAWLVTAMSAPPKDAFPGESKSKSRDEWQELAGGVPDGARNNAMLAVVGKLISSIRDLNDVAAVDLQRIAARLIDQQNDPPLEAAIVDVLFNNILSKEVAKRQKEDAELQDRLVEQQIAIIVEGSKQDPVPPEANGHRQWDLIKILSDPAEFLLRTHYWHDSPDLKDGYLSLSEDEIMDWNGRGKDSIRRIAWRKTNRIVPHLKKWATPGGHLERLRANCSFVPSPPETQRILFVLGYVYRYLLAAEPPDGEHLNRHGRPAILADGRTVFRIDDLKFRMGEGHESFTIQEVIRLLALHGFEQDRFIDTEARRRRWWIASAETLASIGTLTKEGDG